MTLNGFAGDHSIQQHFKANNHAQELNTINALETMMADISNWMGMMRLKLNNDRTEFIMFGYRTQLSKCVTESFNANCVPVKPSQCVKYLGANLDQNLKFKDHINQKCRKATDNFFGICNIHRFLNKDACQIIALGLGMSHLDYSNNILYGLPNNHINQLQ